MDDDGDDDEERDGERRAREDKELDDEISDLEKAHDVVGSKVPKLQDALQSCSPCSPVTFSVIR